MAWLPALTTVSLFFAGVIFWLWQTVYRRRFEVAEASMIAFEKAVDGLNHIRNPFSFESESKEVEIPEALKVPPEQYRRYGVIFVRAEKTKEVFAELRPAMILAEIHLGTAASEALSELWTIRHEVVVAAGALANCEKEFYDNTPEAVTSKKSSDQFYKDQQNKLYNLGKSSAHDVITPRIEQARKALADACRPYLELPRFLTCFSRKKTPRKASP